MSSHALGRFPLALALVASALLPAAVRAQGTATVIVRVSDSDAAQPLPGAQLRIVGVPRTVRSDSTGRASLDGIPTGSRRLELRRIGYEPLAIELTFAPADTVELELALLRVPPQLDTVAVVAAAVPRGLEEFDARRSRGLGEFLAPAALSAEGNRELGDVLASRLRGLRVVTASDGISRYLIRNQMKGAGAFGGGDRRPDPNSPESRVPKGTCIVHLYLDGVSLTDPDISFVETRSIAAAESYTATNVPPQYRRAGAECGVVLLWTRSEPGG